VNDDDRQINRHRTASQRSRAVGGDATPC
jgi:hypothetical protein